MFKFDFFRLKERIFNPKTPASAMKAFEAEILPIEVFIYKATSIKPLDEEPYDIPGIERVLARKDLDIKTYLLIIRILKKLINNEEPEIALFAAESINLIEDRYNKKIERIKKRLGNEIEDEFLFTLSNLYFELSLFHNDAIAIRNFYLKEAFSYINKIKLDTETDFKIYQLKIYILCDLELYDHAMHTLKKLSGTGKKEHEQLLLEAEISFRKKNFVRIFEILSQLKEYEDKLTDTEKSILNYWLEYK
jgi:hypothetical protein